jgi:hypothetical protein
MNVARLNFSHGTRGEHLGTIARLRRLAEALHVSVAVLQDLAGPKVRVGAFAGGSAELQAGAPFTLTTRTILGTSAAASGEELQQPMAPPQDVAAHVLPTPREVADRFLGLVGDMDRRQLASAKQPNQLDRVAPIGLNPLAGPARGQCRGDHLTVAPRAVICR